MNDSPDQVQLGIVDATCVGLVGVGNESGHKAEEAVFAVGVLFALISDIAVAAAMFM